MARYEIIGGNRLEGNVTISGAKNAAVAILPAVILVEGVCRVENVPDISDVRILLDILADLGAGVKWVDTGVVELLARADELAARSAELKNRIADLRQSKTCPACGASCGKDDQFCRRCGGAL